MTFPDKIVDSSKYIGQLATKTVAWEAHANVAGVMHDLHHLMPFSIAMGVDLMPWLNWIVEHNGEYGLCFFRPEETEKGFGDLFKYPMDVWSQGWVRRVNHAHAHTFLPEWRHVLGAECFAKYRQTKHAASQLGSIAFEMITTSVPSENIDGMRGQWAYDTLRLCPDNQWGEFALKAWAMIGEEERTRLNPKWAEWYALFGDDKTFMDFVRSEQEPKNLLELLVIPDDAVPNAL